MHTVHFIEMAVVLIGSTDTIQDENVCHFRLSERLACVVYTYEYLLNSNSRSSAHRVVMLSANKIMSSKIQVFPREEEIRYLYYRRLLNVIKKCTQQQFHERRR